ncbi:MAG: oxaloacetate decarboxylase, alpha subunit [Chloroflexi bacterium]|jgi:oxaloacetate decarboxylase alpha subunit|nr:MAG: oxaloacetate decarboxylase, alpha subunit [Chloroflexota bacterium]
MTDIHFIDTTVRDGNQSLWAFNMKTGMMLSVLPHLDEAGFDSIEFYNHGIQIKKLGKDLGEDALEWLKRGTALKTKTELRLHGGIRGGLSLIPLSVRRLMVDIVVAHGVTLNRSSNSWNDFPEHAPEVEDLRKAGMRTVVNVIYSISPRHTTEYYRERVAQAAAINPYRICFKDVGGLLTPERTRELVPIFKEAAGDVELEFHAHSNNGLAPINALEVAKGGIKYIHTAVPPVANGSSQPSIFNVAQNLRALGFHTDIDEEPLHPVTEKLTTIAHRNHLPIGAPRLFDQAIYGHQVPGGMISNLAYQLKLVGMEHRLQEALEETVRVREDFGYPIMVTPLSQFVGSQAAMNVILGERYKLASDAVIQYALGLWGREATTAMNQDVRAKILDRSRARELASWEPPQPSIKEVRAKFGRNITDEEMVLRFFGGDEAYESMGKSSSPEDFLSVSHPVVTLINELSKRERFKHVVVQKGDFSLSLRSDSGENAGNSASD